MTEQVIRSWTDAFMAEDWDKISEIYAEDTVGQDPAGTIMKGREENIAGDKMCRSMLSDFKFEFGDFMQSGNTCVVEMEVTATMTGEMEMPDGSKVPPTGKTHTMKGCLIVETENGKQKNQRMYADMMSMMQGFGIMPG